MKRIALCILALSFALAIVPSARAQESKTLDDLKREAVAEVDKLQKLIQEMVDSIFSFAELGLSGIRDQQVRHRHTRKERVQSGARRRGHPDRLGGELRFGQTGHRLYDRHRLHSARFAKTRRRLSRPDHPGRARSRRGAQFRPGRERRRRDRPEADDGEAQTAGHAQTLSRRGRRAGGDQSLLRSRGIVQRRGHHARLARRQRFRHDLGPARTQQRTGLGAILLHRKGGAFRRARPGRAAARSTPSS